MAHELVLRGGLQIISTPGSGTGDPQLTLDIATKIVGEVPAVDSSTFISKTLATGNILVGSNTNIATAVPVTGVISLSSGGITTLQAGVIFDSNVNASAGIVYSKLNLVGSIVNTDINASAAITRTKLAVGTAYRVIVNSSSGIISELAALTAARVLVSDANGQPIAANPSTTEINFVVGVTSAIQTQLGNRLSFSSAITPVTGDIIIYSGGVWTRLPIGTAGQVLNVTAGLPAWGAATANGLPTGGTVGQYLNKIDGTNYNAQWSTLTLSKVTDVTATLAQVNVLATGFYDATSSIQSQLTSKLDKTLNQNYLFVGNVSNVAVPLASGANGYILTSVGGAPTWVAPTGGAITNGSGTTAAGTAVNLGGTLTGNAAIDGHFNLTFGSTTPLALFSAFGGLDLTTFSSLSLNLSAAQLRHFEPAGITGSLTLDSTSATLVGGLAGANPHTQIVLSGTAATFTDTRATPVGLQEAADYSTNYTNLSYTNKGYVLGAKTYTGKQTFVQTTTTSPINLGGFASDPSVPLEGEISYNTTSHLLKFYDGTSWVSVNAAPPAWLLASGGTLTGANTIDQTTTAGNIVKFLTPNLGVTSIDGKGLWIQNATSAAAGAQQISGSLILEGQGWATTPVASRSAQFKLYTIPIQGAAAPTSALAIEQWANGVSQFNMWATGGGINFVNNSSGSGGIGFGNGLQPTARGSASIYHDSTNFSFNVATGFFLFNGTGIKLAATATSSNWIPALLLTPGAHNSLTAATEFKDYNFNTRTATWLAGTTATQRFAHFQGQTVAGASASATFTDLYTVYIDPSIQGSQAIITNNWALGVGGVMSVGGVGTDGKVAFRRSSDASIVGYMSSNGSGIDLGNGLTGSGTGGFRFIMGSSTVLNLFANTADLLIGSVTDLARLYVFQLALGTTGGLPAFRVDGGAHTNLTASVEVLFANFNSSAAVQYATGAQTILRNILVQAPTVGFVGASTITDNATFTISGAPKAGTNTTQTNTHGLLIQAGAVISAGSAFGLTVNAPTGGTLNYAAQTKGGSFLFAAGTTTYAPIIIPTGTNLTTSAAGAMENDGTHLWFTFANSGARWQLDNQVGTFGWALAGNTLVADGIIGDVGAGGFKISLYTNNTARQVISSKGNFTFAQDAQSVTNTFLAFTQAAHTGGEPSGIIYTGGSHTGITPSFNFTDILLNAGGGISTQFVTGNLSLRSMFQISGARLLSFVGASTITDAAAVDIFGSPQAHTNATFTNVHALLIRAAATISAGAATNSYGLTVNAQIGAVNNYSAQFLGGLGVKIRQAAQTVTHTFVDIQQSVHTGGTPVCLSVSGAAHTTLAAGVSFIANQFAFGQTSQFASNTLVTSAHTLQLIPNGFSFVTAGGVITNSSSLNIIGSPISVSNCNITNSHGILISSASAGAGTTNSYGITVNAMTTATNNYAAQFLGGRVNFAAGTTTYAPILLVSGTNTTTAVAGAVEYDGTNLFFTPSGTTRKTAALYQVGRVTAQTAANASIATWTVGANDGSFLVSANVLVTTSTTHTFTVTCSYTDEGNTARVLTLPFYLLAGTSTTSIANAAGAVPYEGVQLHIRCKASTTITIATTGTFTTVTYNAEGSITQIN